MGEMGNKPLQPTSLADFRKKTRNTGMLVSILDLPLTMTLSPGEVRVPREFVAEHSYFPSSSSTNREIFKLPAAKRVTESGSLNGSEDYNRGTALNATLSATKELPRGGEGT